MFGIVPGGNVSREQIAAARANLDGLMALVTVMADPKATKKQIDELKEHLNALEEKHNAINAKQAEVARALKTQETGINKAQKATDEQRQLLEETKRKSADIDRRRDLLVEQERALRGLRAELDAKQASLTSRENTLAAHEAAVAQARKDIAKQQAALEAQRAEHDERIARLKALVTQ